MKMKGWINYMLIMALAIQGCVGSRQGTAQLPGEQDDMYFISADRKILESNSQRQYQQRIERQQEATYDQSPTDPEANPNPTYDATQNPDYVAPTKDQANTTGESPVEYNGRLKDNSTYDTYNNTQNNWRSPSVWGSNYYGWGGNSFMNGLSIGLGWGRPAFGGWGYSPWSSPWGWNDPWRVGYSPWGWNDPWRVGYSPYYGYGYGTPYYGSPWWGWGDRGVTRKVYVGPRGTGRGSSIIRNNPVLVGRQRTAITNSNTVTTNNNSSVTTTQPSTFNRTGRVRNSSNSNYSTSQSTNNYQNRSSYRSSNQNNSNTNYNGTSRSRSSIFQNTPSNTRSRSSTFSGSSGRSSGGSVGRSSSGGAARSRGR